MFGLLSSNPLLGEPGSLKKLPPPLSCLPTYPPTYILTYRVHAGSRQGCTAQQGRVGQNSPPACCVRASHRSQGWSGSSLPVPGHLPSEPGSGRLSSRTPHPLLPHACRRGWGAGARLGSAEEPIASRAGGPTKLSPDSCLPVLTSTLNPDCKETRS